MRSRGFADVDFAPTLIVNDFQQLSSPNGNSRTLEHLSYMWGCKGLYQARDETLQCPEGPRKVDVRLPGKGNSDSHGARPVHLIITMIQWILTSRLTRKNSLSGSIKNSLSGGSKPNVRRGVPAFFRGGR